MMSLHCDIFFKKNKYVLVKLVYLSAMYRFDQGIVTRLNIADVVLKEYKKDESSVSEICSEAMFKFWRENGCQLIRYGFNELCKWKDQSDQESAALKSILHMLTAYYKLKVSI